MRLAFTNDILKLKEDFYLGYHFRVVVFYVSFQGIDQSSVDVTPKIKLRWDEQLEGAI